MTGMPPDTWSRAELARALSWRLIVFAGVALLAYPPVSLTPLIFVAFAPYIDAVRICDEARGGPHRRFATLILYFGGALFYFGLLHWLMMLPSDQVSIPGLIVAATVVGALYLGVYALFAQWAARSAARLGVPLAVSVPVAWVASEYLRTQTQLGCPWGLFGYALTGTPILLQTASWIGVFGVSLVVALVNGLVFTAWRSPGRRRLPLIGAGAVVALLLLQGTIVFKGADRETPEVLPIALIQGNIGRDIKFKPEYRATNIQAMIDLSDVAVGGRVVSGGAATMPDRIHGDPDLVPELVIWPETAAPCRLSTDMGCQLMIRSFVDRTRVPVFTGFPALEFEGEEVRRWNSSALIVPEVGIVGRYHKVNLVPFGEAIPYQETVTAFQKIDFGEADFTRGPGFDPVRFGSGDFGVMICYEAIFPEAGRVAANRGARFFVNITNDEWFARSAGPYQHAAMSVGRSIECRRGLVRAANTGVSFVIDRLGRVSYSTPLFERHIIKATVELGSGATLYMRIGDLVPRLCVAASLLGIVAAVVRRRRAAA